MLSILVELLRWFDLGFPSQNGRSSNLLFEQVVFFLQCQELYLDIGKLCLGLLDHNKLWRLVLRLGILRLVA